MFEARFISIEGIEGAGKSTALEFIKKYLAEKHIDAIFTREPGGTPFAEEIRFLLLHAKTEEFIQAKTELLMMFAGRSQHLSHCILPALRAGKWVVSDRYIDATYAYQGGGRGMDQKLIQLLDAAVVEHIYPQLTLLFDIDAAEGLKRAAKRGAQDRIEQEAMGFFDRVRQAYLLRAQAFPERIKVIDASAPLAVVENNIRHLLDKFVMHA